MKIMILFVCITTTLTTYAQKSSPLQRQVEDMKKDRRGFGKVSLFQFLDADQERARGRSREMEFDERVLDSILGSSPETMTLDIPLNKEKSIEAELVLYDFANETRLRLNNDTYSSEISRPLTYRGIVKDAYSAAPVVLTLNERYISLFVAISGEPLHIESKRNADNTLLFYNGKSGQLSDQLFECGTSHLHDVPEYVEVQNQIKRRDARGKCVYVFVDCSNGLFMKQDTSVQNTVNYVYNLYNQVGTAFLNDQIQIKISEINVWTVADPFRHNNRDSALKDFAFHYRDNFWGNIAVSLDFTTNRISGVAAGIGKVKGDKPNDCGIFDATGKTGWGAFCYNDLNYGVNLTNFPDSASSSPVYLIIHEMGHLLGSPHTQWCGWVVNAGTRPPTLGALDNCATVEGSCSAGPAPVNGGTFMSYCVNTPQFVDFNNGFGELPGQKIRDFINNSSCIPPSPECPENITIPSLPAGEYRYEVSNTITGNKILAPGTRLNLDAGVKIKLQPGFKARSGSRVHIYVDGCGGIR